jgi:hypothetical protein
MEASREVQPIPIKGKGWQPGREKKSILTFISPQMAQGMLARNTGGNRTISRYRVDLLTDAILSNEWVTNPDAIAFDEDGNLTNGQHRLTAILKANKGVHCYVTTGMSKDSFVTTDTGKVRGAASLAEILGMRKYSTSIGAAVNLLYRYENDNIGKFAMKASNNKIREMLANNRGLENSAMVGQNSWPVLPPGVGTFCHYIFSRLDKEKADAFFKAVKTGSNLTYGSPILALRERMMKERASKSNLPHSEIVALTIKAWNAYRKNQKVRSLRWSPGAGEDFPKVI